MGRTLERQLHAALKVRSRGKKVKEISCLLSLVKSIPGSLAAAAFVLATDLIPTNILAVRVS